MLSEYLQRRLDLKNGVREKDPPKARQPLRKQSEKAKAAVVDGKKLFAEDKEFYADIWSASPHVCQSCGKHLPKEPLTLYFHHLIPKGPYPQFRHTHENIMILCPDCHTQAESDLDKVPRVRIRTNEARALLLGEIAQAEVIEVKLLNAPE